MMKSIVYLFALLALGAAQLAAAGVDEFDHPTQRIVPQAIGARYCVRELVANILASSEHYRDFFVEPVDVPWLRSRWGFKLKRSDGEELAGYALIKISEEANGDVRCELDQDGGGYVYSYNFVVSELRYYHPLLLHNDLDKALVYIDEHNVLAERRRSSQ